MTLRCFRLLACLQSATLATAITTHADFESLGALSQRGKFKSAEPRSDLMRALEDDLRMKSASRAGVETPQSAEEERDVHVSRQKGRRFDVQNSIATRCAELAARFPSFDVKAWTG
jgi:hypothetical protein